MNNFHPKLEDAKDDQLQKWTNEMSPNFAKLVSDELTRRSLNKLQKTMNKANRTETKLTQIIIIFMIIQIFIALFQFLFSAYSSEYKTYGIFLYSICGLIIFYILFLVNKKLK